jgi:hypothetical protein
MVEYRFYVMVNTAELPPFSSGLAGSAQSSVDGEILGRQLKGEGERWIGGQGHGE